MKGVLIIAHGSRRKNTVETMEFIINKVRESLPTIEIVACFMEFAAPNVLQGLETLKAKGVTEVIAVPYFLFDGIHIKEDIPKELDNFRKDNPEITIKMGQTLGEDPRLAQVLSERIQEAI